MINDKIMNKIIRKKIIWAEIKAKEQEYKRLQKQINELEQAQADISFEVQKKLNESQEIAEYLDQLEYEALCRAKGKQTGT
jgi:predicted nuclease with TOPRIM domain